MTNHEYDKGFWPTDEEKLLQMPVGALETAYGTNRVCIEALRVPGGWIFYRDDTACFVSFPGEYKHD